MVKQILASAAILSLGTAGVSEAAANNKRSNGIKASSAGYAVISPIFSQLVSFTLPVGFTTVWEDGNKTNYLREAVPAGETVESWTQMVTVTGAKGLSGNPNVTPRSFASAIAGGFEKACPDTYSDKILKEGKNERGYDQFVAVVSCGATPGGSGISSESALIVVIKGDRDYYTVQWAERGSPSGKAIPVNPQKWKGRLAKLTPINICPIVPGEAPPYPSCLK